MLFFILSLFLLFFLSIGYCLSNIVCRPKVYSDDHEINVLKKYGFDYNNFDNEIANKKEFYKYESKFGYNLNFFIVKRKEELSFSDKKERVIILCHGYTGSSLTMSPYAKMYYDLGFNLILYDHRYHGRSEGSFCSMSYYEAKDLIDLFNHVYSFFPSSSIWGLHGESMGSATVMTAAPSIDKLNFCIEDCGFTSLKEELIASMKYKFNFPSFPSVQLGSLFIKMRFGFSVNAVRPIDHVKDIKVPMLFVHGDSDKFVPTSMVYKLYKEKKDDKQLHIFESCTHAKSLLMKKDEYKATICDFLNKYKILGE